ncbi:hypothetical protein H2203_006195 [Taxawa tesnikishii (nom. ined.)]|nr:hypothetical protein H2203_006195 [Dothideales sp. JES 119]
MASWFFGIFNHVFGRANTANINNNTADTAKRKREDDEQDSDSSTKRRNNSPPSKSENPSSDESSDDSRSAPKRPLTSLAYTARTSKSHRYDFPTILKKRSSDEEESDISDRRAKKALTSHSISFKGAHSRTPPHEHYSTEKSVSGTNKPRDIAIFSHLNSSRKLKPEPYTGTLPIFPEPEDAEVATSLEYRKMSVPTEEQFQQIFAMMDAAEEKEKAELEPSAEASKKTTFTKDLKEEALSHNTDVYGPATAAKDPSEAHSHKLAAKGSATTPNKLKDATHTSARTEDLQTKASLSKPAKGPDTSYKDLNEADSQKLAAQKGPATALNEPHNATPRSAFKDLDRKASDIVNDVSKISLNDRTKEEAKEWDVRTSTWNKRFTKHWTISEVQEALDRFNVPLQTDSGVRFWLQKDREGVCIPFNIWPEQQVNAWKSLLPEEREILLIKANIDRLEPLVAYEKATWQHNFNNRPDDVDQEVHYCYWHKEEKLRPWRNFKHELEKLQRELLQKEKVFREAKEKKAAEENRIRLEKEAEEARVRAEKEAEEDRIKKEQEEAEKAKAQAAGEEAARLIIDLDSHWDQEIARVFANTTTTRVVATSAEGVELKRHDMGTLLDADGWVRPGAEPWLNDEIVNAFFAGLVGRLNEKKGYVKGPNNVPAFVAYSTVWYKTYKDKGADGLKNWSRRKGIQKEKLLRAEKIFFPVNPGAHWTLLVISPKARTIEYLDSFHGNREHYHKAARNWLSMELGDKYDADEWLEMDTMSATQYNGTDCGVFTCMNGLALAKGVEDPSGAFDAGNMRKARRMIAAVLLNGGFKGEFDV